MANDLTAETIDRELPAKTGTCPNCQAELRGTWCYYCGQSQKPVDRFFLSLVSEAFEDVFSWDSRAAKTIVALLFRPGFLTTEYFAGRRARYVPPLRLYLISSLVFFFLLSLQNWTEDRAVAKVGADGLSLEIADKNQATEEAQAAAAERIAAAKQELASAREQLPADLAAEIDASLDQAVTTGESGFVINDKSSWVDEMSEEYDRIEISWLSREHNAALRDRLKAQTLKVEKMNKEDPGALLDALIDVAPPIMFVLLPLFAVLLKVTYLGSGRYYTEHLVLAVHNHSFLYLILVVDGFCNYLAESFAVFSYLRAAALIWIPVYMYLSMKRVYRQGYFLTFIKYCFLGLSYNMIFIVAVLLAFLIGVMTL